MKTEFWKLLGECMSFPIESNPFRQNIRSNWILEEKIFEISSLRISLEYLRAVLLKKEKNWQGIN